jgi:hypothetical protein
LLKTAVGAEVVQLDGEIYFVGTSSFGYYLVVEHLGGTNGSGRIRSGARSCGVSYRAQEGARA